MDISKRVKVIQTSKIRKIFDLAAMAEDPYDLSLGVPELEIPQSVKQAAVNETLSKRKGYSPNAGFIDVRRKVAEKLESKNNIEAKPEEVIITAGVTAGLWLALAVLVDEGDEVIIFDPYFVPYPGLIEFLGGKAVKINTYPNWNIPWEELQSKITPRTKAILFNTPNNPTGKAYERGDVEKLAEIARKNNLWIISDEIYEEIIFDKTHTSAASLYPNTITLMGPSKSASLAGYRVAYLHAPKDIIPEIVKLQQLFYVCAPLSAQMALAESLDLDYVPMRSFYRAKRDMVRRVLGDYPGLEGAFYGFFPSGVADSEELVKKLIAERVLTVPGSAFSDKNSHFRISYSVSDDKLKAALEIIKANLRS